MIVKSEREWWFKKQYPAGHRTELDILFEQCPNRRSNLKRRRGVPRSLQCLFSRYRIGLVESCGRLARHLNLLSSDECRLNCGWPFETVEHLLLECPETKAVRTHLSISPSTLQQDSPSNIVAIALFDRWFRHRVDYDGSPHFNAQCDKDLNEYMIFLKQQKQQKVDQKRKRKGIEESTGVSELPRPLLARKRRREGSRLIIKHPGQRNLIYQG